MNLSSNTINADDYGMSSGKNAAILMLAQRKLIHSTSVSVVNGIRPADAQAISRCEEIELGLHVNLSDGFSSFGRPYANAITQLQQDSEGFMDEIEFQFDSFVEIFGFPPSFLDSHQHFCYLSLMAFRDLLEASNRYKIPIRSPKPFIQGAGLSHFVKRIELERNIKIPFDPNLRAIELRDALSLRPVEFRTPYACIDLNFGRPDAAALIQSMSATEIVCHPEIFKQGANADYQFLSRFIT